MLLVRRELPANVPRYRFPLAPPSEEEEVEVKGVRRWGRSEDEARSKRRWVLADRLTRVSRTTRGWYITTNYPASTLPALLLRSAFSTASDGLEVPSTIHRTYTFRIVPFFVIFSKRRVCECLCICGQFKGVKTCRILFYWNSLNYVSLT